MSDLPDGWEWAPLGELCQINPRDFDVPPGDDEPVSLVRMSSVGERTGRLEPSIKVQYGEHKKKSLTHFQEGDVVFAKVTPCMENGKIALAQNLIGERALGSSEFFVLRPARGLDPNFLLLWLLQPSVRANAETHMTGAVGLRRVPRHYLETLSLPLPPLTEQHRIVAALEEQLSRASTGDEQVDRVRHRLSRLRDHVQAAAACGQFEAKQLITGSARPPLPTDSDDGTLPAVPENWTWYRLGEISDISGGITRDSKKQNDSSLPHVPYLRVANVQRGYLDLNDVAHIRVAQEKADALKLKHGDVLLNEGGDRDKLGRGWVWEGQIAGCIHQNHVFRVRLHKGTLNPKLLAWHANGFGRRWFFRNGKQSTNLASIKLSTLKQLPVPVPPVEEQERLITTAEEQLTRLDLAEHYRSSAKTRTEQLRSSLLREAFAGRLVSQDPNDEPASVLLERIRTESPQSSTTKRTSRTKKSTKTTSQAAAPASRGKANSSHSAVSEFDSSKPLPETPVRGAQDTLELDL